jgi:RNA polymerase sigma-70 factor (ECF subfamily)
MSWLQTAAAALRPPDRRPMRVVDQEILDELQFHIEMRTLDNAGAGLAADAARQDALRRFGDFERIHKACRRIVLGERIMLQRIQAILTVLLLGAVVFLGVEFYRGQRASEATAARMTQILDNLAGPSVAQTVPRNGDNEVDPSLAEIRVTYDREMSDGSWSWCQTGEKTSIYPETTGNAHYEADHKTCVLPVKLAPGTSYALRLNSGGYRNFMDIAGRPALPYLLQFKTRQQAKPDGVDQRPPAGPPLVDRGASGSTPSGQGAMPALELPPADLEWRAAGSDGDAQALIERMLKANQPWIEPTPVKAAYSVLREAGATKERSGPFSITPQGCRPAVRVGSIVWTPLHNMAGKAARYTLRMVGKAKWKDRTLVAVDVVFDPPVTSAIGLGGQSATKYSSCEESTAKARIMIEPDKAIPRFIDCTRGPPRTNVKVHSVWAFDADFFEIDGGFAPKMFVWEDVSAFRERQEFQVVGGVWIFKRGDAWWGAESPFPKSGRIQTVELVDLQIPKQQER